ncbi:transcription factor Adf-1-like [Ornithodoros turicata]|uniref:transcription factor Adf-1-like n=1 Tax=Ornithodoros turicata TaxID=34597 RepID=UPI003138D35F
MAESTRVEFNEKLIYLVEERPSLWDMRSKVYKNIHVKNKDWRMVAELLDATEKQVQSRWRNLRDSYSRIVRDTKGKSGDPAKEVISTWPHYDQMSFLRDIVEPRKYEVTDTVTETFITSPTNVFTKELITGSELTSVEKSIKPGPAI